MVFDILNLKHAIESSEISEVILRDMASSLHFEKVTYSIHRGRVTHIQVN